MTDKTLISEELAGRIHGIAHAACVGLVAALTEAGVTYSKHLYRLQAAEPVVEAMARGYCDYELHEFAEFEAKSRPDHV